LGYDDTKPYVANIEFKANNESKATMKDGAVSILEGVKKPTTKIFQILKYLLLKMYPMPMAKL